MSRRYAEGTTVRAEDSQAEVRGLLAKHGVERFGMVSEPAGVAIQFVWGGLPYRFEVTKPTVDDMKEEYDGASPWQVDWHGRADKEWRRRWRARLLWLKALFEFATGEGRGELERALLPYLVLPTGETMSRWADRELPEAYRTGSLPALEMKR